jgi:antitoxin component YwqK of YwqJK toxin-antitoxin module
VRAASNTAPRARREAYTTGIPALQYVRVLSALFFLLCFALAADESEDQVLILPKNPTDAEIGVKTTELNYIRRRVNTALADRPAGAKARVTLRSAFSNHPEHYGVNAYPYAVVPLNEAGLPDGTETFVTIGVTGWSGQIERKLPWKNGKRDGEEQVFKDGKLEATIPWVNDQIHGVRRTFHANGKLAAEAPYVRGLPEGVTRNFDSEGRLMSAVPMKAGKRHGVAREFWPETGKLKREIHYDMGRVVGVTKEFYATGKLKREVPFQNNALHGVETVYEADGTISVRRYWRDGEPVSQAEFEKRMER